MQREEEIKAIKTVLIELHDRAYRAGLPALEYLLELAVLETGNELKRHRKKRGLTNVTSLNIKQKITHS